MNAPLPRFEHCHILHVDDNEDDSFLFKQALVKLGFDGQYEWVPSGEAALSRLSDSPMPNVIVADGYRAAGPELLRRIRETVGRKDTPIVVYSGDSDKHAMNEALRNGATGYVLKRTTFEESIVAVGRIMALCGDPTG